MVATVLLVQGASPDLPLLRLVLGAASGAAAYTLALVVLWIASGRPNTVEADLVAVARLDRLLGQTRQK